MPTDAEVSTDSPLMTKDCHLRHQTSYLTVFIPEIEVTAAVDEVLG